MVVNNETQVITLSGVIRPEDVTSTNHDPLQPGRLTPRSRWRAMASSRRPSVRASMFRFLDWLNLF